LGESTIRKTHSQSIQIKCNIAKEKENPTKAVRLATNNVLKEPHVPYPKAIDKPTMSRKMTLTHQDKTARVKAKDAGHPNLQKAHAILLLRKVLAHTAIVLDTFHANAVNA
jgi:hypothetical protein